MKWIQCLYTCSLCSTVKSQTQTSGFLVLILHNTILNFADHLQVVCRGMVFLRGKTNLSDKHLYGGQWNGKLLTL